MITVFDMTVSMALIDLVRGLKSNGTETYAKEIYEMAAC